MVNKFLLYLLCGGLIFGSVAEVFAASSSSSRNRKKKEEKASKKSSRNSSSKSSRNSSRSSKKSKTEKEVTKKTLKALQQEQKLAAAAFDASKPSLTREYIQRSILQGVFDPLVGKEIPEDMKKIKKSSDTVTFLGVGSVAFRLKVLINNPELPEVTRIPLAWYTRLAAHIDSFRSLASAMDNALSLRNPASYAKARAAFMARQEVVKKFMDAKPPRIPSKEYAALRKKNTLWRRQKFQAYQKKQMETFLNGGKEVKKPVAPSASGRDAAKK